jgi:hypothetical protein
MAVVRVQCYSVTKANERPIRFELGYIVAEWSEPKMGVTTSSKAAADLWTALLKVTNRRRTRNLH